MMDRGGEYRGGPRYGWGGVQGSPEHGRSNWNTGQVRGGEHAGPEAGLRRGEWQWRGHGPGAWQGDYGWDYLGGVGRDEITQRTEAGMGGYSSQRARMAEERSGGLPENRDRYSSDRWFARLGEGRYDRGYGSSGGGYARDDFGWGHGSSGGYGSRASHGAGGTDWTQDRSGGGYAGGYSGGGAHTRGFPDAGGMDRDEDRARRGGYMGSGGGSGGGGHGYLGGSSRGYGAEYRGGGGYGRDFHGIDGGGYRGGYPRNYGGYDRDVRLPELSDRDFWQRVNRW